MRRIFDRSAEGVNSGLLAVALLLLASTSPARAQENFEIQVYGSETMAPGTTMIELHTNSALRGSTRKEDGVLPTEPFTRRSRSRMAGPHGSKPGSIFSPASSPTGRGNGSAISQHRRS
jgi:hypothetical protein